MTPDLRDQVALVTGAGRGIGRAVSLALAGRGALVVAASRTKSDLETLVYEIEGAGGRALAAPADVSSEEEIVRLFERVRAEAGRLDVLVNNAGIGLYGPVAGFAARDLDALWAVNLRGAFLCCREAMKVMMPRRSGYIINVSSVVGFKAYPDQAAYAAVKHGVMGLTKSLAIEAQPHGIRVSAVLPGGVDTDLVRAARPDLPRSELMAPEDIAHTVCYLLSLSDRAAVDQVYIRRRTSKPF
jgi:3-oxoacyl-[acyl-carrier protein] reductase